MAKMIYSAMTSLDGYVADEDGNFEWAELDEEVLAYINERERQNGTYLFGRKVYETMSVWETPDVIPMTGVALEYVPIWQAAEKIVYSTTLQTVSTAKTRIERKFDADAVRESKKERPATLGWVVRGSQPTPLEPASSTSSTYSSRRLSRVAATHICRAT